MKTPRHNWFAIALCAVINLIFSNNLFTCNPVGLSLIEGGASVVLFSLYGALLGGWQKNT